jgi:glycerate dehydrogenase
LVTFSPSADTREAVVEGLGPLATVIFLRDLADDQRSDALASADAVMVWNLSAELRDPDEFALLGWAGLIQLLSAGADHVPFGQLPAEVPIASNAGAYAGPMAEHVLALALALAKRLPQNQAALRIGSFDQQTLNRTIRGSVVGVLGFGGIGQASARLFGAFGARIYALNRSGHTDQPVERIGPLEDLDELLAVADIVVVAVPLTRSTRGLIGKRELALMKPDAIIVNVARGAIIDEDALYEHLRRNESFSAGIDAWWQEHPFKMRRPFLELPNVIGSPHNSGITVGTLTAAARQAAANIARYLRGEPVENLVDRSDYGD